MSKILLTLTLVLSTFTFTGYGNSKLIHTQKFQIELVCSAKTKANKPVVAFNNTKHPHYKNSFLNQAKYKRVFLFTYNNLIQVRLNNISKKYLSIPSIEKLLHLKDISQISDRENFPSIG